MTAYGRGRPAVFEGAIRDAYLELVAAGARLGEAAAKVGVDRRTVTYAAQRDPHFRERLDAAKTRGRGNRIVHGDANTYDNWDCRCGPCTADATKARTGRRERQHHDTDSGEVVPLPHRPATGDSFPLASSA